MATTQAPLHPHERPKNILVTHGSCPDGCAAAVLASRVFPHLQIVWGVHNSILEQVLQAGLRLRDGGTLILADICGDAETLQKVSVDLKERGCRLLICEHHQTRDFLAVWKAPEGLQAEVIFDNNRCGSKIFFDRFVGEKPDLAAYQDFIRLTNDRDLWLNQDPKSAGLAKLHHSMGDARYLARFLENPSTELTLQESTILEYQARKDQEKIEKLLERIELKDDDLGNPYGVIYGEADSTELLHQAIQKHDLEYAIHINLNAGKGSIRGRGKFDCAAWAEKRGGGGHKNASGFPVKFVRPKY